MNEAAGDDWGELFVLRLRDADSSDAEDDVYTLEFCSRVDEDSDSESVSGLITANTVASRLNVSIAPSDQHVLLVDMEEGNTVICLRCMHLATLLRACALLIAQQLVCLCSGNETVGLTGICSAPETKRIYQRIFQNFETVDFVRSVDMCTGTLRNESAEQVPQSLVAVADMLWTWYDNSSFMFNEPLALQIKGCEARACECGASRELPHVATEPSVHAAGGQLVHLRHLCAAAKLTETPYSSADETTEKFTNQLRLFGNNVAAQDPTVSVWSAANIAACVEHAVSLIDSAAGENWGELFRLNVRPPDILNPIVNVFLLQFSSNMEAKDDEFIPRIKKVEDAESVVARLVLRIQLHKAPTPHKVSVSMASGQTAVCVRCMHLATLLRACALLVAQQIAYLGSPADSVLFKGDPVSEGTRVIYSRLCRGLDTTQRPNADDSCYQIAARLRNPGTDTIPQSVTNVSEQLWRWYDQSAFMCRQALPAQIRAYKARACECGTQRKTPHVFPGYQGVQVHGEHAQACAHPAHLCAAAALPHEPYSSPQETAETLTGRLSEFGDECKQAAAGGSAWSWQIIRACLERAVLAFDDVAGAYWDPMFQLSAKEVETIEANTLIHYLQFEGKAVLPDDAYQPFSLIPSDQCVLSRLKLVIKEADPAWFTPSEYTMPYNSGPLPAQIRHTSASAALASVGPAAPACHRAPAQASVHTHEMYPYHDVCCLMQTAKNNAYRENWKHVLDYLTEGKLTYETIRKWPYRRRLCFWIWWKYTWQGLLASHSEVHEDEVNDKLKSALLYEHIPGASLADFFQILPAQIENSVAMYIDRKIGISDWYLIDIGVESCKNANDAEQAHTDTRDGYIFDRLMLFFALQVKSELPSYQDAFSIRAVKDAFEHLEPMWHECREAFARQFAKLQERYHADERIRDTEIQALISCLAPAHANARPDARAARP